MFKVCSVRIINCFHPRNRQIGLPCLLANAAHVGGSFPKSAAMKKIVRRHRHGCSRTKAYGIWAAMKRRCYNKTEVAFKDYGGRGIKVCARWKSKFANFLRDMGQRPAGMCLERKNNNGDYSPENCVWASMAEQNRNRRSNHWLVWNGVRMVLSDWSRLLGRNTSTMEWRYHSGWSPEMIITTPVRAMRKWRKAERRQS